MRVLASVFPSSPDEVACQPPYHPPRPAFVPCAVCACLVLVAQDGSAISPALGYLHLCGKNCACAPAPA